MAPIGRVQNASQLRGAQRAPAAAAGGLSDGGRVENATLLRTGTLGGPKNAAAVLGLQEPKKKKKKNQGPPPTRVGNASALRQAFIEVANCPDGIDPDPLTLPKCVECAHCGWPVWPREARAATRKTYERAGIERSYTPRKDKKKKEAKDGEEGEEGDGLDLGDEEDDEDDEDSGSVDTVEFLENKVSELEEENGQLKALNDEQERTITKLNEELEKVKKELEEAHERIELLLESEKRWREKNSNLRIEVGELKLFLDRQRSRIGDLESDMVKKLLEIRALKEKFARFERRRQLMLVQIEKKLALQNDEDLSSVCMHFWQKKVADDTELRDKQEMERRRRQEVAEINDQVDQEKERVVTLRLDITRLKGNLHAAASRFLQRAMSTELKPWAPAHCLRAWVSAHPTVVTENVLEETRGILKQTHELLKYEQAKTAMLERDLAAMTNDRDRLQKELDDLTGQYMECLKELEATGAALKGASADVARRAAEAAAAAKKAIEDAAKEEARQEIIRLQAIWEEERQELEDQIGSLEAQLESTKRGMGGTKGEEDELKRVVPRGQGTMCVGCMKQLVHRDVKQLPPVHALKSPKALNDEKGRLKFFGKELEGQADPEDFLHTSMWKSRRDPLSGLRYAAFDRPDPPWPKGKKSVSASCLTPLKLKEAKVFRPGAFR